MPRKKGPREARDRPESAPVAPSLDRSLAEAGLRALYELAVASGARAPEVLARLAVDRAMEVLHPDGAAIFAMDGSGLLRPLYQVAPEGDGRMVSTGPRRPGEGAVGQSFRTGETVSVDDYQSWPDRLPSSVVLGVSSVVAVPMRAEGRIIGVLGVWSQRRGAFSEADAALLGQLADQVAPAIDAARSVAALEASADTFVALHDLAVAAGGGLDAEQLASRAVQHARRLLDMDRVVIYWWDEPTSQLLALAEDDSTGRRGPGWANEGEGAVGMAFARLEAVLVEDYQSWEHARPWSAEQGFKSAIAVPMLVKDRPVGAITCLSYERRPLGLSAVRLLTLLAAQVTPALDSARLRADLVASEERFRSLHDTIPSGVVVQGPGGDLIHANRAAREMLGLSPGDRNGPRSESMLDMRDANGAPIAPEMRPAHRAFSTRLPVRSASFRLQRPDGSWRWFEADSVPVLDRVGKPVQVVTSIIDVTERMRAESALLESERRYHVIFDRVAIGILRVAGDGAIVEANPAVAALLGYPEADLIGKRALGLLFPGDEHGIVDILQGDRDSTQFEGRCIRRDGTLVWTSITASLVRGAEDEPLFAVLLLEDISQRKRQEAELEHQALHDALTGLPNRLLLHDRLHHALRRAEREAGVVALLAIDLDRFKEVNDTHGHHVGDALLRAVADRLRGPLRETDTVARLGGDEFAVVLPGVGDPAGAGLAARRLLRSLELPFDVEGTAVEVGASIGIALFPDHGIDADALLRHADVAMYSAKRSGSGHSIYSLQEDAASSSRLTLVHDLRAAIEGEGLYLEYQPKVDLRSGRIAGVEALVRWRHPEQGALAPAEFLPVAEQTGLIGPLTMWVFREALKRLRTWERSGVDIGIAVNLSARTVQDVELAGSVLELLASARLRPGRLLVEIGEGALMRDPVQAASLLGRFQEAGVEVSIDDFGTGYSSLSTLRRLPAAEIKIDSSFVAGMAQEESDQLIVRSIVDLGHNLRRRVVAKGVEDAAALTLLKEMGCDFAQGSHLHPPMGVPALLRLVRGQARAC